MILKINASYNSIDIEIGELKDPDLDCQRILVVRVCLVMLPVSHLDGNVLIELGHDQNEYQTNKRSRH